MILTHIYCGLIQRLDFTGRSLGWIIWWNAFPKNDHTHRNFIPYAILNMKYWHSFTEDWSLYSTPLNLGRPVVDAWFLRLGSKKLHSFYLALFVETPILQPTKCAERKTILPVQRNHTKSPSWGGNDTPSLSIVSINHWRSTSLWVILACSL